MKRIWILNDLYIDPVFRRMGLGTELMDKAWPPPPPSLVNTLRPPTVPVVQLLLLAWKELLADGGLGQGHQGRPGNEDRNKSDAIHDSSLVRC